jgi:flagellar motility protein MotE (MotC chaperone)
MKTEAAASQLAAMPEAPAAAIVAKMQPKMAGSILADMDPARAARLTSIMAGAAEMGATAESAERGGPPR